MSTIRRIDSSLGRQALFGVAATRRIESAAASTAGPFVLMQRAGDAAARLALALAPHARRVLVFAGPGNNGGDGIEAATRLCAMGKAASVLLHGDASKLPADAARALARAQTAGVRIDGATATGTGAGRRARSRHRRAARHRRIARARGRDRRGHRADRCPRFARQPRPCHRYALGPRRRSRPALRLALRRRRRHTVAPHPQARPLHRARPRPCRPRLARRARRRLGRRAGRRLARRPRPMPRAQASRDCRRPQGKLRRCRRGRRRAWHDRRRAAGRQRGPCRRRRPGLRRPARQRWRGSGPRPASPRADVSHGMVARADRDAAREHGGVRLRRRRRRARRAAASAFSGAAPRHRRRRAQRDRRRPGLAGQ